MIFFLSLAHPCIICVIWSRCWYKCKWRSMVVRTLVGKAYGNFGKH